MNKMYALISFSRDIPKNNKKDKDVSREVTQVLELSNRLYSEARLEAIDEVADLNQRKPHNNEHNYKLLSIHKFGNRH